MLILDKLGDSSFLVKSSSSLEGGLEVSASDKDSRPTVAYLPYYTHDTKQQCRLRIVQQRGIVYVRPIDRIDTLELFEKKSG